MAKQHIAIWGQYKSGTTALFYKIRPALKAGVRTLFEPRGFTRKPQDHHRHLLAKIILADERVDYASFAGFVYNIYLIRDCRDWLISGLLFLIQQEKAIYENPHKVQRLVALLQRKENAPQSVSISSIMACLATTLPGTSLTQLVDWMRGHQVWLEKFEKNHPRFHRFKYEDLVDEKLGGLSNYLGLSLDHPIHTPRQYRHVPRTKGYGNWRHWFTPGDVDLFQPIFSAYLQRHGYGTD